MAFFRNSITGDVVQPGVVVGGVQTHDGMSLAAWASLGYAPYAAPTPTLAEAKLAAIAANRTECQARILAAWPEFRQRNCALGLDTDANVLACKDWIDAHIDAENTAANAIDACTTIDEVKGVKVIWP